MPTAELRELLRLEDGRAVRARRRSTPASRAIRNVYRPRGFTRATVRAVDGGAAAPRRRGRRRPARRGHACASPKGRAPLVGRSRSRATRSFTEAQLRALSAAGAGPAVLGGARSPPIATASTSSTATAATRAWSCDADGDARRERHARRRPLRHQRRAAGHRRPRDHRRQQRTSTETIERELLLRAGAAARLLGAASRASSGSARSACSAASRIEELPHAGEPRRDVLVQVEEAPPTTIGYGGGVEGGIARCGRPARAAGRGALRGGAARLLRDRPPQPVGQEPVGQPVHARQPALARRRAELERSARAPTDESGYGFNEYRVVGTFREPRVFDTRRRRCWSPASSSRRSDRASTSSAARRAARPGMRLSPALQRRPAATRFEHTEAVRRELHRRREAAHRSAVPAGAAVEVRRARSSATRATTCSTRATARSSSSTTDLAARAIGSEVGFVKTFLQGFVYRQLPTARRTVLALGARLGVAHGFRAPSRASTPTASRCSARRRADRGHRQDLPASERFFAGGDTTVRGFSLDRLGDEETISDTGLSRPAATASSC